MSRRYLISFNIDDESISVHYKNVNYVHHNRTIRNYAMSDINHIMIRKGFDKIQYGLYLSNEEFTEVDCMFLMEELETLFGEWFYFSVKVYVFKISEQLNMKPILSRSWRKRFQLDSQLSELEDILSELELEEHKVNRILDIFREKEE